MCVDHRGADVLVAEQFLNGTDVVPIFEEMGGERVTEGVAGRWLRDPRSADRVFHRSLEHGLMEMVTATLAGLGVHVKTRGRKYPLPPQFAPGVRVLAYQRARQLDPGRAAPEIGLVRFSDALDVTHQGRFDRGGEHRHPVLPSLAVADHDLVCCEIDVLYTQAAALEQTQPGTVEQHGHEPRHAVEALEDGADFVTGEDDR